RAGPCGRTLRTRPGRQQGHGRRTSPAVAPPNKKRPDIAVRPVQQGGITTWGAEAPPRGQLVRAAPGRNPTANCHPANQLCATRKSYPFRDSRRRGERGRAVAFELLDLRQQEIAEGDDPARPAQLLRIAEMGGEARRGVVR